MREETDNPLEKKSRILACLFRPSRSTYSQDVCEQLRPTCSINLPCHDMYKCSCPSRQSNFKIVFGHCFSLGRRGNHVRVRACNVPSECNKHDCRRLLIVVMPKCTERNPTFFFQRVVSHPVRLCMRIGSRSPCRPDLQIPFGMSAESAGYQLGPFEMSV